MLLVASCSAFLRDGAPLAYDDQLLLTACQARGIPARVVAWDDPSVCWEQADLVVVRSTWDYIAHVPAFLGWMSRVQRVSTLFNAPHALTWNLDKRYMRALEARGVPLIPTRWLEPGSVYDLATLLAEQGWQDAVLKPVIGTNSAQVLHIDASQHARAQEHLETLLARGGAMLQPYIASVASAGERSHVFLDGRWSHVFTRTPFTANRPEQQFSGAITRQVRASEKNLARAIYAALEVETHTRLLFARIDLVSGPAGEPLVMEAELIEPVLRLEAPEALDRLMIGIQARLAHVCVAGAGSA